LLGKFILATCGIAHSSAAAERLFSEVNRTKTSLRNRFGIVTLSSLIRLKQDVRKHGSISAWAKQVPKELINVMKKWYISTEVDEEEIDFVQAINDEDVDIVEVV